MDCPKESSGPHVVAADVAGNIRFRTWCGSSLKRSSHDHHVSDHNWRRRRANLPGLDDSVESVPQIHDAVGSEAGGWDSSFRIERDQVVTGRYHDDARLIAAGPV